jgi:hypothetical protein
VPQRGGFAAISGKKREKVEGIAAKTRKNPQKLAFPPIFGHFAAVLGYFGGKMSLFGGRKRVFGRG